MKKSIVAAIVLSAVAASSNAVAADQWGAIFGDVQNAFADHNNIPRAIEIMERRAGVTLTEGEAKDLGAKIANSSITQYDVIGDVVGKVHTAPAAKPAQVEQRAPAAPVTEIRITEVESPVRVEVSKTTFTETVKTPVPAPVRVETPAPVTVKNEEAPKVVAYTEVATPAPVMVRVETPAPVTVKNEEAPKVVAYTEVATPAPVLTRVETPKQTFTETVKTPVPAPVRVETPAPVTVKNEEVKAPVSVVTIEKTAPAVQQEEKAPAAKAPTAKVEKKVAKTVVKNITHNQYVSNTYNQTRVVTDAKTQKLASYNNRRIAAQETKLAQMEANTNKRFSQLKGQVDANKKAASAGIAGVAAMANIPQVTESQTFAIGAGAGSHDGESAMAVGFSARVSEHVVTKASVAMDTQDSYTVGAGVSVGW